MADLAVSKGLTVRRGHRGAAKEERLEEFAEFHAGEGASTFSTLAISQGIWSMPQSFASDDETRK